MNALAGEDTQRIKKSEMQWLQVLIRRALIFLFLNKVIKRLNQKITLVLMILNMKISQYIQLIYEKKV